MESPPPNSPIHNSQTEEQAAREFINALSSPTSSRTPPYPRETPSPLPSNFQLTSEHVIVPSTRAEFLLDNAGHPILKIYSQTGATVQVDPSHPGPSKKFDITGSLGAVHHCATLIQRRIEDCSPPPLSLWVPAAKIGKVIGSKGSTIRHVNNQSGAIAQVHNDRVRNGCKEILIKGRVEAALLAEKLITGIIEGRHEPLVRPKYVPHSSIACITGESYSILRSIHSRTGATLTIEPYNVNHAKRRIFISGNDEDVIQKAIDIIDDLVDQSPMYTRDSQSHPSSRQPAPCNIRHSATTNEEETFQLSAEQVTMLIGSNGGIIKDIENRSSTMISATGREEAERSNASQTVAILGNRVDIKIAKAIIEDKLGMGPGELSDLGVKRRRASTFDSEPRRNGFTPPTPDRYDGPDEQLNYKDQEHHTDNTVPGLMENDVSPINIDTRSDPKLSDDGKRVERKENRAAKEMVDQQHSRLSPSGGETIITDAENDFKNEPASVEGKQDKLIPPKLPSGGVSTGGAVDFNSFPQYLPPNALHMQFPQLVGTDTQIANGQIQTIPSQRMVDTGNHTVYLQPQLFQSIPFNQVPLEKSLANLVATEQIEKATGIGMNVLNAQAPPQYAYAIPTPHGPRLVYSQIPSYNGFPPTIPPQLLTNPAVNSNPFPICRIEETNVTSCIQGSETTTTKGKSHNSFCSKQTGA